MIMMIVEEDIKAMMLGDGDKIDPGERGPICRRSEQRGSKKQKRQRLSMPQGSDRELAMLTKAMIMMLTMTRVSRSMMCRRLI